MIYVNKKRLSPLFLYIYLEKFAKLKKKLYLCLYNLLKHTHMKKITLLAAVTLFIFSACNSKNEDGDIPPVGTIITVSFNAELEDFPSKASDPLAVDQYLGGLDFSHMALFATGTSNNRNRSIKFFADGEAFTLQGSVASWEGESRVTVVHPYDASGYSVNDTRVTVNIENQFATEEEGVILSPGLWIGSVSGAVARSTESHSIPSVMLKKPTTSIAFELVGVPSNEIIYEIGIRTPNEKLLSTSADFNLESMTVIESSRVLTDEVSTFVLDHKSVDPIIVIPFLPVDLMGKPVEVYIKTFMDNAQYPFETGEHYIYKFAVDSGTYFIRGIIYGLSDKPLNLLTDFVREGL